MAKTKAAVSAAAGQRGQEGLETRRVSTPGTFFIYSFWYYTYNIIITDTATTTAASHNHTTRAKRTNGPKRQ